LAPRLPALPPTGVSGGLGLFKKAHGVRKSVNQTSAKSRVFFFVPSYGFLQLLGSFLADFNDQD